MELQTFTQEVVKALCQYYDAKVRIETHQVYKNNGILLQGICALQEGKNIAPTVYLNDFFERYQQGESLGGLVREIVRVIERNQVSSSIDVDFFRDYEQVRRRLVFRLIHKEKNKEMLKEVPYMEFKDLAVVCHCALMTEEIGSGNILIRQEHLKAWNVTKEQMFADAKISSPRMEPCCILKMSDMVRDILEESVWTQVEEICGEYPQDKEKLFRRTMENMAQEIESIPVQMYVLTNRRRLYGAACMVYPGVLKKIADMLEEDYYILPSSVHEIIFIGKSKAADATFLNEMIQEVNLTQVDEEEWLSDHTYLYQRETQELYSLADQ